jgi:hypothetical protein
LFDKESQQIVLQIDTHTQRNFGAWTTRNSAFESNNYQSSLMFKTFQKAAFGYENRPEFPPDAFICDDCTLSTKYIVFDGKVVGPKKHAIDH